MYSAILINVDYTPDIYMCLLLCTLGGHTEYCCGRWSLLVGLLGSLTAAVHI